MNEQAAGDDLVTQVRPATRPTCSRRSTQALPTLVTNHVVADLSEGTENVAGDFAE